MHSLTIQVVREQSQSSWKYLSALHFYRPQWWWLICISFDRDMPTANVIQGLNHLREIRPLLQNKQQDNKQVEECRYVRS